MSHTPGPWTVGLRNDDSIIRAGEDGIAHIFDVRRFGPDSNIDPATQGIWQANARLIAAAPDLLAASQAVIAAWHSGTFSDEAMTLRAAIAKATTVRL
jgi:hypothetical protein